jgi:integrase
VAYVEERKNGWLVVWNDAEDGKRHSRLVPWGGNPESVGGVTTVEGARVAAEGLRDRMKARERRARKPYDDMVRFAKASGQLVEPIFGLRDPEPDNLFENFITRMVERDAELRASTRELYLRNIRIHIHGTQLAVTDVREVDAPMLSDFWAAAFPADGDGRRPVGAMRNVHQLLSKVFKRAIQTGLIDVNPLDRAPDVKRPGRGRRTEVDPLTVEQVEELAAAATNQRDRLEILVMAYGGLRAGEVGGLRKQDIARKGDRCQLRLRQQVARVTGTGQYIEELKTKAAKRTVDIPCSVAEELGSFLKDNPPAADGRVFHGPNGEMRAHNAILHGVKMAGKRVGLPSAFSHQLRHTAVSLWIEDGANPKDIQRMVGHSSIRETMDTYGHLFDYGGEALATGMEARREAYRNGGTTS